MSPSSEAYPFRLPPRQHQLECWLHQRDLPAEAILFDVGAGKSKELIDQVAWNFDKGRVNGFVVVCPKGNYLDWPDKHIPTHMPLHVPCRVATWYPTPTKAQEALLTASQAGTGNPGLDVFVMNVEALVTKRGQIALARFLKAHKSFMAIDESTSIMNPKAERTKACIALGKLAAMRRILSGQPAPNGPLGVYSQFEFLEPGCLGFDSFFTFRARFANLVDMTGAGGRTFKRVIGYRNAEQLNKLIQKRAWIVKKKDCLDLPPKTYITRRIEMGPKQAVAYRQMERLCMAELEQAGEFVTPELAITKLLRLHQILCGFLATEDKVIHPFDEPNPRLEALIDDLRECSGKVVIWATYKYNVAQIRDRIAEEYGPETVVTYYGPNTKDERQAAVIPFDATHPSFDPDSPVRFIVLNKTGARGLTLTEANTALYFSNDYDADTRMQNEARIDRMGQIWPMTYIDYVVPQTQDEKITLALQGKISLAEIITASLWRKK